MIIYFTVLYCILYGTVQHSTVQLFYLMFRIFFVLFFLPFFFTVLCSCTTRCLWDLWWFGNTQKNMAPYRTHTALDYVPKRFLSYLSRARKVMEKIESLLTAKYENLSLSRMNINDSRIKFAIGFDDLCVWLSPERSIEELDVRHYGDAMYLSFYDRILKERKKRKLAAIDNISEV